MISSGMKEVADLKRYPSPTVTPQALAWDGKQLWMSSRDLGALYRTELDGLKIVEEIDPPGVVWAGVATNDGWRFTIGKGLNDDRHVYRYTAADGFEKLFSCPEFTGSYLSFDGEHLYLSQWYKERILKMDDKGNIQRQINIGAEICGHTFVEGMLYVLRGRENKGVPNKAEEWRIARLSPQQGTPKVDDLAHVPFPCRSLTFDGANFWTNHRAANEIVSFTLPD
jgi:sugar lactone lactonase YvrE